MTLKVALATSLLAAWAAVPLAATPPPPMEPAEAFQRADGILEGTATSCDVPSMSRWWFRIKWMLPWRSSPPMPEDIVETMARVRFSVSHVWKGRAPSEVDIVTLQRDEGDCGTGFTIGTRYLVYACPYGGALSRECTYRTAPIEFAKDDLAYFATRPALER